MREADVAHLAQLGTVGDRVEIVPSSDAWPAAFAREADRIRAACGDLVKCIEHIGSTAVPGLSAKPILDLMPGLTKVEDGMQCVEPMERLGYASHGEYGIAGRHFFTLQHRGCRVVHVHMFVIGSADWNRHLVFRDLLRSDATARAEYESLKKRLAVQFGADREGYAEAKTTFIASRLEQQRKKEAEAGV